VYTTLDRLKEYLGISDANDGTPLTRDDTLLKRFITKASRSFDAFCHGRRFYPIKETRYYDHPGGSGYFSGNISSGVLVNGGYVTTHGDGVTVGTLPGELLLDDDLLQVDTLTTNNGDTTISASDYFLMTGNSYNFPPYERICLKADGNQTTFEFSGTAQQANAVTGYWGYHERWADAWVDSQDTVQDNPLSSSATSLTVSNADGSDILGITPRFQVFQLLRIESEYLFVTAINTTTNVLTVIRGVNGTTAASHVQNTTIEVYEPMEEIVEAMDILAAYSYRRKDSSGGVGSSQDRPITMANGVIVMPNRLPSEVTDKLGVFKRRYNVNR